MAEVLTVKQFGFTLLFIIFSQLCVTQSMAQDTVQDNTQDSTDSSSAKTVVNPLAVIGIRYINDSLYVPLRSGGSSGHRIVHKGLKSGTKLSLLQSDETSQYSLVRTSKGLEGWIPTQYLIAEPTAALQLKEAEKMIAELTRTTGPIGEKLIAAEKNNQQLTRELKQLEEEKNQLANELEHLKSLSSNVVELDNINKRTLNELELLKSKRDTIKMENERLKNRLKNDDFINGALAVIFGIIVTLIIQYLAKSNKRSSEWR